MKAMRFVVLCRVIDNLGDAGFCLRLSRALTQNNHEVLLLCDQPEVIHRLQGETACELLRVVHAADWQNETSSWVTTADSIALCVLEPFGTSAEHATGGSLSTGLKALLPKAPWLVIDYLSAEDWTQAFHGQPSVCPRTGHVSHYFYPGFNGGTGGVIHQDAPRLETKQREDTDLNSVFVFSYTHAPVADLIKACEQTGATVHVATDGSTPKPGGAVRMPFCVQADFDAVLAEFDFLMVRGEDSFVRAQLAGKPLVWHIYPTADLAHVDKLQAFLDLYTAALDEAVSEALKRLWWIWNGLEDHSDNALNQAWADIQMHYPTLLTNARRWAERLRHGPELVSEILTWSKAGDPTFGK